MASMFKNLTQTLKTQWAFFLWIVIFAFVLVFGMFGRALLVPWGVGTDWHFCHFWEVGALGSTVVFNFFFYIFGFFLPPKMFLHLRNGSFAGLIVLFEIVSIVCLVWAVGTSLKAGNCLLQLLAILIVTISFWALDWVMARQSTNKQTGDDFRATVRLSDAPAFMAFGVLFAFSWIYQNKNPGAADPHGFDSTFRAFIGGAI